ncbi:MAG: hypothetical protein OJF58_000430 [Enhydrobacter sp.]|nr:MAG: hypothetical protein OJF58_000430 [Enhydrobacter sp.]
MGGSGGASGAGVGTRHGFGPFFWRPEPARFPVRALLRHERAFAVRCTK